MTRTIDKKVVAVFMALLTIFMVFPNVAHASSTQITGRSTTAQTVYTGPSSSNYESAGSIGANEEVYILGKEKNQNWYHIQYHAGSKQKSGYVPTSTITSISGGTPSNEEFYGGYAVSTTYQTVWSCDDASIAVNIGSVSANEGVTRLYAYGNVMYIEYSTSGKAKRGYVFNPQFSYPENVTCAARVTNSSSISYGLGGDGPWATVGSVAAGEYVAVIAGSNSLNTVYVEYNTSSGRKRGYMSASNLEFHGGVSLGALSDMYGFVGPNYLGGTNAGPVNSTTYVYAGPGYPYASVGYLDAGETYVWVTDITINNHSWSYIHYKVNGAWKSGFIY
ncbi:MAG: hypothetical protein IJH39_00525 [Clostridia bacterium]|nr:hypothetical protein [Clostridia bacterium]